MSQQGRAGESVEETLRHLEKGVEILSKMGPVVAEIQRMIREREGKKAVTQALLELTEAISRNIEQDISSAVTTLENLAEMAGRRLKRLDAERCENAMKFAQSNLTQIGDTLKTASEIVSSRFPELSAYLRSMTNEYSDLIILFEDLKTPTAKNPRVHPDIKSQLELLRRKIKSAGAQVSRVKSKLEQ